MFDDEMNAIERGMSLDKGTKERIRSGKQRKPGPVCVTRAEIRERYPLNHVIHQTRGDLHQRRNKLPHD